MEFECTMELLSSKCKRNLLKLNVKDAFDGIFSAEASLPGLNPNLALVFLSYPSIHWHCLEVRLMTFVLQRAAAPCAFPPVGVKESNMPLASVVPVLVKLVPVSKMVACFDQCTPWLPPKYGSGTLPLPVKPQQSCEDGD